MHVKEDIVISSSQELEASIVVPLTHVSNTEVAWEFLVVFVKGLLRVFIYSCKKSKWAWELDGDVALF